MGGGRGKIARPLEMRNILGSHKNFTFYKMRRILQTSENVTSKHAMCVFLRTNPPTSSSSCAKMYHRPGPGCLNQPNKSLSG